MTSEFENYVVEAIINFYNYDYEKFFEYLDEAVIWYGPKENQFIVGKDNLINAVKKLPTGLSFNVDNISTKLIPFVSTGYTVVVSYTLKVFYPDRKFNIYFQRVVINAHRHHDKNGEIFWRCPLIHVSNTETSYNTDDFTVGHQKFLKLSKQTNIEDEKTKPIILPGDNHSSLYIKPDSINYIVGGKGVMCYVHTDEEQYLIRKLLKDVMLTLPEYFYRCHSSYIINLKKVLYLSSQKIILADKSEIPISSRRFSQIKSDINNWMCSN